MAHRIDADVNRFKDIIKQKVKKDLGKYISSENLIGKQGDKFIKIPIHNIDLPRFRFGSEQGGASQGDGNEGDPIDGEPGDNPGKGKAGKDSADHEYEAEFTPDELAQILGEKLQLPALENKGKGQITNAKGKYTDISHQGPEGLRHFRRTFKESLKRVISSGTYDPLHPTFMPRKEDKRYRASENKPEPAISSVVIYMMDCSGSMGDEERFIAKSVSFWIDLWLKSQYKNIESRFIVHDAVAKEVTKQEFFTTNSAGGTQIASAYKHCADLMEKEYPFSNWNVYPIHFSDGDVGGWGDDIDSIKILKERIIPNSNSFSYGQISNSDNGFYNNVKEQLGEEKKVNTGLITNRDDIMECIRSFLGKGQ